MPILRAYPRHCLPLGPFLASFSLFLFLSLPLLSLIFIDTLFSLEHLPTIFNPLPPPFFISSPFSFYPTFSIFILNKKMLCPSVLVVPSPTAYTTILAEARQLCQGHLDLPPVQEMGGIRVIILVVEVEE